MTDLAIPDYHDIGNALARGPSEPAVATFHVTWMPGQSPRRFEQIDAANRFRGEYAEGITLIRWSAHQPGFRFVSDPSTPAQSMFAIVGHERNGVYFDRPAVPTPTSTTAATLPTKGPSTPATRPNASRQGAPAEPDLPATGGNAELAVLGAAALALGGLARYASSAATAAGRADEDSAVER